jgi:ribonuclease BN (tRNA processing enzyme)
MRASSRYCETRDQSRCRMRCRRVRVEFFKAEHRVPTVAVRVSVGAKTFAFSADTLPCKEVIACAKNADLFLCDALCAELDGEKAVACALSALHAAARQAAAMASRAGAGALACTHIARFGDPDRTTFLPRRRCSLLTPSLQPTMGIVTVFEPATVGFPRLALCRCLQRAYFIFE